MPTIKLFGNLRSTTSSTKIEIPGKTVREVLANLELTYPNLVNAILINNELYPHIRILITGKDIELLQGLDTPLTEDEHLAIFPAIAGG